MQKMQLIGRVASMDYQQVEVLHEKQIQFDCYRCPSYLFGFDGVQLTAHIGGDS